MSMNLRHCVSRILRCLAALAALAVGLQPVAAQQPPHSVLYGFTAFPYDLTVEAESRIDALISANASLYAIHMDECMPWAEALADKPFPKWLEESWKKDRGRIGAHQTVYVAVTPTSMDRHSLAPACGAREGSAGRLPSQLRNAKLSDAAVKRAYVNFVKRVVQTFNPKFLNIGIEISELALKHPKDWPAFQELFLHTYREVKQAHPEIQIGIEMVLQTLLVPKVAALVKPAVEASDYLGISFYPYASSFGEYFGAPRLPPPPAQWRNALDWLRGYTSKPIAICETGYTTESLVIKEAGGLPIIGDATLQKAFLEDIVATAKRDQYLFVVWFVLVDYTRLLAAMPGAKEWMRIWVHAGLFTPTLEPKPAWDVWQLWKQQDGAASPARGTVVRPAAATPLPGPVEALQCSGASTVQTSNDAPRPGMRSTLWIVRYAKDWELCRTSVAPDAKARGVRLWIKSDKSDQLLLRLEERSGEAFFELVPAGPQWQEIKVPFSRFKLDPQTRRDGRLLADQIELLWIGEGAGVDGATGSRAVWIADLGFYE